MTYLEEKKAELLHLKKAQEYKERQEKIRREEENDGMSYDRWMDQDVFNA